MRDFCDIHKEGAAANHAQISSIIRRSKGSLVERASKRNCAV